MASREKASTKKREGVIVHESGQTIKIQESEELGLTWNADGPMTSAGKVNSASGAAFEDDAATPRTTREREEEMSDLGGTTTRQTAGMGHGRRDLLKKPRIQTSISGPTSRAEPNTKH